MFSNIIVVCTGNICRSPIAEALLRKQLAGRDIQICSAGTGALVGYAADPFAQLVSREQGYDISAHRAQQASPALLSAMDLILTLDQTHTDWVRMRFPHLLGRTHKLGRWRNNMDIADPYRRPREAFEEAFQNISACTEDWLVRLSSA